jgi:hypothetical protein
MDSNVGELRHLIPDDPIEVNMEKGGKGSVDTDHTVLGVDDGHPVIECIQDAG